MSISTEYSLRKVKALIEYLGLNYFGWQIQNDVRTVQDELQKAVSSVTSYEVKVFSAGRTDRGVNALGQVIHFEIPSHFSNDVLKRAINAHLDYDIRILDISDAHSVFDARRDALERQYIYRICNTDPTPFKKNMVWFSNYKISIDKMLTASKYLLGLHDFTSFAIAKTEKKNKKVNLKKIMIFKDDDEIIFFFSADHFLHKMVRTIVGTLVDIGREKKKPGCIKEILNGKDRRLAGYAAPPQGLYLYRVLYKEDLKSKLEKDETDILKDQIKNITSNKFKHLQSTML